MVTHPTNLRLGFQPELHVNVKEEKRRPSPGIPKPCGGGTRLHSRERRKIKSETYFLQEGRYFQVLTNAVGIREYGTLVMLSHESVEGS